MTDEEMAAWVDHLDLHAELLGADDEIDVPQTLGLLTRSVAALLRLEADRMRVSADPEDPGQMQLFPGVIYY